MARQHRTRFVRFATEYADQTPSEQPTEFVIPEDLSVLSDEDLRGLHEQAVEHFDALYGDGTGLSDADLEALTVLTQGIETLTGELSTREQAAREREQAAAELAARAHPSQASGGDQEQEQEQDPEQDNPEGEPEGEGEPAREGEGTPQAVAASAGPVARREIRVNLGDLRSRQTGSRLPAAPRPASEAQSIRDVLVASGEVGGYQQGQGLDWDDVGRIVDRRLMGFNQAQYDGAARSGTHLRQQHGVAMVRKPLAEGLTIESSAPEHVDDVLRRAMDETRLPGGSLVASGGWCAPSETIYDLCEMESRDGLVSVPEIGIARGGISFTPGPDFATIYNAVGFDYTEAEDVAGTYVEGTPNTVGDKPCYKVPCPTFSEVRLNTAGLCITAGLLQQRGYPEVIARTVRGALVAHDHKMSARIINAIVAGSTPVTMPAGQIGLVSPILTSIELQVEHYRYTTRLARGRTLEAIFPYWIRGAIRTDLARRSGSTDNLTITDAQITAWFNSRGVNAQFVYDWQPITGAGDAFTTWPTSVQFLLYAAGTWVRGTADVITLDTLYDSVLLGTNDYTALFTEEGYLVAKLCHDSRVVTVPVCANGQTSNSVAIGCNGAAAA